MVNVRWRRVNFFRYLAESTRLIGLEFAIPLSVISLAGRPLYPVEREHMRLTASVFASFVAFNFLMRVSGEEPDALTKYTLREYNISDLIGPRGARVPGKDQESVIQLVVTILPDDSDVELKKGDRIVGFDGSLSLVKPIYLSKSELSIHAVRPAGVVVRATDNGHARLSAFLNELRKPQSAAPTNNSQQ